jgi:hypothetical protein
VLEVNQQGWQGIKPLNRDLRDLLAEFNVAVLRPLPFFDASLRETQQRSSYELRFRAKTQRNAETQSGSGWGTTC